MLSNVGGSVTEEGKRTCPLADRPILEALRLPSSVTSPQSFRLHKSLLYFRTLPLQESYCIGAVPPSPREKAFARGNVSAYGTRRIIDNIKETGSAFREGSDPVFYMITPLSHKRITSDATPSLLPRRRWRTACDGVYLYRTG